MPKSTDQQPSPGGSSRGGGGVAECSPSIILDMPHRSLGEASSLGVGQLHQAAQRSPLNAEPDFPDEPKKRREAETRFKA